MRTLSILFLTMTMGLPAQVQQYPVVTGSLTASNSACVAAACVSIPVTPTTNSARVQVGPGFTGTVQFEMTLDGTNYAAAAAFPAGGGTPVTSATAAGIWSIPVSGMATARVRCSAFSSGPIPVTLTRSVVVVQAATNTAIAAALSVTSLTSSGAVSGTTGTFTGAVTYPPTAGTAPSAGIWAAGFVPSTLTTGTDTTGIANQQWIAPVWVPCNMTLNGVSYLIATGGTDRAIAALYNAAGTTLLANSTTASAGTVVGSSSTMQALAFTSPYAAVGPGLYWITIQTNGTTAHIRTVPLGTGFTGVQAAGGATPAATIGSVPASFVAANAPVAELY